MNRYATYGFRKNMTMGLLEKRNDFCNHDPATPRRPPWGGWIVIILLFFLLPPPLAHAASNGRISGQLLNATKSNTPVVGQSVTLQMAQGDNARDLASVKTDAHGTFAFNNLATDKTLNYAIYTRYQGAQYYTNLINLSSKPVQQINLMVYEATPSSAKIAIVQATVLLHQPDAQAGVLSISEVIFFKNLGTYTYVGSLDASKGKPNALLFTLPPGARNVSLSKGFDGYQAVQVDRGFASDAALPPSTSQFIFSFELPYTTLNYNFSYEVIYPTVQLSLLVPPDLNVKANTLTSAGLITADQHPYRLFQAKDLLTGLHIQAQLQGLPVPPSHSAPGPLSQNTIWLIVAILLMLAILTVTWFLLRSTRNRRGQVYRARGGGDPIDRTDRDRRRRGPQRSLRSAFQSFAPTASAKLAERVSIPARGARNPDAKNDLQNQQQALLQELLDLDKVYESGKLKKSLYQEQRAKTKARLRTLMTETGEKPTKSKGAS